MLHFIQCVGAFLDGDCVAVANNLLELVLLVLQDLFKLVHLGLRHYYLLQLPNPVLITKACKSLALAIRLDATSGQKGATSRPLPLKF